MEIFSCCFWEISSAAETAIQIALAAAEASERSFVPAMFREIKNLN